ncbi:MAG TPA: hypothetical protein VLM40_16425 [Gemmata sp.]|nr:hypothetical protein [Gemmata sp.]
MNPGPPINYQVSQPPTVTDQFLLITALARAQGRLRLVLRASRYLLDELAYDPIHFGESRGTYPHLQLEMRIAFVPPVYIWFAVHEPSRQVFIRRLGLT